MADTETTDSDASGTGSPDAAAEARAAREAGADPALPRVRTYAGDLSSQIRKQGATLTSIVGAERERAAREIALDAVKPEPQLRRGPLLWGTVALIAVGAAAIAGALWWASRAPDQPEPDQPIIFANETVAIDASGRRPLADQLAVERTAARLSLGEIARLTITIDGATTTPRTIMERLGAPSVLAREVADGMFGLHSFNYTQPFIILRVQQYDRAYAAMLSWEEELGRALGAWYQPQRADAATTTIFRDVVYRNIDTRQSQPAWPIVYAFVRRDILVITTNEQTLQEVMTRLAAAAP